MATIRRSALTLLVAAAPIAFVACGASTDVVAASGATAGSTGGSDTSGASSSSSGPVGTLTGSDGTSGAVPGSGVGGGSSQDPCNVLDPDLASATMGTDAGTGRSLDIPSQGDIHGSISECLYLEQGTGNGVGLVLFVLDRPQAGLASRGAVADAIEQIYGSSGSGKLQRVEGLGEAAFSDPAAGVLIVATDTGWFAPLVFRSEQLDLAAEQTLAAQILQRVG